jgi:hypothetical protein
MADSKTLPTVAEAQKAAASVSLRENPSLTTGAATITVIAEANPKRPNSAAYAYFGKYGGMRGHTTTVSAFLKAGGRRVDIRWDFEHGYITLTAPPKAS